MIGKNPLWVSKQQGHSVQTMLEVYAAWTEGSKEADIEAIKHAMQGSPLLALPTQRVAEGASEGMPIAPPQAHRPQDLAVDSQ